MGVKNTTASWYRQTNKNNCRKPKLNAVISTKVLACILWILKNLDNDIMQVWLAESSHQRAQNTLSILTLCINRFYNNSNNYKKVLINIICVSHIFKTLIVNTLYNKFLLNFRVTTNVCIVILSLHLHQLLTLPNQPLVRRIIVMIVVITCQQQLQPHRYRLHHNCQLLMM